MKLENLDLVKERLEIAKARLRQVTRYVRDIERAQGMMTLMPAQRAPAEEHIDTLVAALDTAMTSLKEAQGATDKVK